MSTTSAWLARISVVAIVFAGIVVADETGKAGMPTPQKAITAPFLEGAVGAWTVESVSTHEGKEMKGTGKSAFAKAIGATAVLQTFEITGPGPDGKSMTYHGHGVYKVSDDGKTATLWWFCNMSPDVMKLTGSITDTGLELSGPSPMGSGTFKISIQKSATGVTTNIVDGENTMKATYTRAK